MGGGGVQQTQSSMNFNSGAGNPQQSGAGGFPQHF